MDNNNSLMNLKWFLIGVLFMWVAWQLEFKFVVLDTGIMKNFGQQYHVIPWDGKTP